MSIDSDGSNVQTRARFAKLANKRRVLTIFPDDQQFDGFTEAGFTFHAGNGPGKDHGWRRSNDFSRPLANTKRTL